MLFLSYCKLVYLGTLSIPEKTHLRLQDQFRVLLEVHMHSTNQENPIHYSWEIVDLLSYVLSACPNMPITPTKEMVSTCRWDWCLSSTLFPASFSWYYILKNPAIWLAESVFTHNSKTRNSSDMEFVKKY